MPKIRAVACLLMTALAGACSGRAAPHRAHPDPVPAVRAFEARVEEYLVLHRELEAKLPKLGKEATPEEIDKNQRELGALLQAARPNARKGEFFTPEMQQFIARLFDQVFQGESGKNLLGSIMDENPGIPQIAVDQRYPDAVPLSTMPPEILSVLPKLEEDMEYRFVGRRLVLMDAHAHTIVDFTDELLPG